MNKQTALILFIPAIFLIGVLGVAFFGGRTADVAISTTAQAGASLEAHDWGTIRMDDGPVTADFPITNTGSDILQLYDVATSCACTSAWLQYGETTSPPFGMHKAAPFVLAVPSGETANLIVEFDPAYHGPSGVGAITRTVTVRTNDAERQELNFTMTALVTSS